MNLKLFCARIMSRCSKSTLFNSTEERHDRVSLVKQKNWLLTSQSLGPFRDHLEVLHRHLQFQLVCDGLHVRLLRDECLPRRRLIEPL